MQCNIERKQLTQKDSYYSELTNSVDWLSCRYLQKLYILVLQGFRHYPGYIL